MDESSNEPQRPVGCVAPSDASLLLVHKAMAAGDLRQAECNLLSVPSSFDMAGVWRLMYQASLAQEDGRASRAAVLFSQAFSRAFVHAVGVDGTFDSQALRAGARALVGAGRLYRRMDRSEDAERTHLAAYHLINLHGSFEELWEIRMELGHDAVVGGKIEAAQSRFRGALLAAESCQEEPVCKQAGAATSLARTLADGSNWVEAISMAERARELWREFDTTTSAVALAGLTVGSLQLRRGQALLEDGDSKAALSTIQDAVRSLVASREELLAFGGSSCEEAELCREQIDFAERLQASVDC